MWWFRCSEPFGVGFSWLSPILVAFVRTQDLIEVRSAASSTGTKASGESQLFGVSQNGQVLETQIFVMLLLNHESLLFVSVTVTCFFFWGVGAGCGMGKPKYAKMVLHVVFFKAVFSARGAGVGLEWAVGIDHLAHFKWVIQKGHPGVDWNLGWGTNRIYTTWYPKQPALNGFMVKQQFFCNDLE